MHRVAQVVEIAAGGVEYVLVDRVTGAPSARRTCKDSAGWLRDATRALAPVLTAFPDGDGDDALIDVHRRVSEGRRIARRARAAAIEGGDAREALARMSAITAAERAPAWSARASRALQQLSDG